jgi:tRNA 2-selenouridine synthase
MPERAIESVTVAQLAGFDEVIDVRSPSEYAYDHLPGALNCPVLDDAERSRIGTLHKQVSAFDAKRAGAALIARNIARHLEGALAGRPRQWRPLVYCWRGGKRSGALAHVLCEIGYRAAQLDGGYRSFRRTVLAELATLPGQHRYVALCGRTGSGKSRVLAALAAAGGQTLDLEALAAHRGSVLGELPDAAQPSQRRFESLLWDRLRRLDPRRPVFVEAESRRIGVLHLPSALLERMRAAPAVRIEAELDMRVALLKQDYAHFLGDAEALATQLDCLRALHGNATLARWKALARSRLWDELVAQLLEQHYDPAYERSMARNYGSAPAAAALRLAGPGASDAEQAARALLRLAEARPADPPVPSAAPPPAAAGSRSPVPPVVPRHDTLTEESGR